MERRFFYSLDDRRAAEWGAMPRPFELFDCVDCGVDSDRPRCADCEREIGAGDA